MKAFYRAILAAAATLIAFGVLLGGVGFAMGGRPSDLLSYQGYSWRRYGHHMGWDRGWNHWENSGFWGSDTVEERYDGVEKLDLELGISTVVIRRGDAFSVKAERVNGQKFRTWMDGTTWKIECHNEEDHRLWKHRGEYQEPLITITLPRDFVAKELELEMGLGSLTADGLSAWESDLSVGMGEMILTNFTSGDCDMEIGMGSLEVEGDITGRGSIDCGMGSAQLNLSGRQQDYGYSASVGMGEVVIGGESMGGLGGEMKQNPSAKSFFEIDCSMGSVEITFER